MKDWRYVLRKYNRLWVSEERYRGVLEELSLEYFF